jgi:hypothetical protein
MVEHLAIIRRIFTAATHKFGSAAHLAAHLGITSSELRTFLDGRAMPAEAVLLSAVDLLLEELPAIRREFSSEDWKSLFRQ